MVTRKPCLSWYFIKENASSVVVTRKSAPKRSINLELRSISQPYPRSRTRISTTRPQAAQKFQSRRGNTMIRQNSRSRNEKSQCYIPGEMISGMGSKVRRESHGCPRMEWKTNGGRHKSWRHNAEHSFRHKRGWRSFPLQMDKRWQI
jgi:hypothetical protein